MMFRTALILLSLLLLSGFRVADAGPRPSVVFLSPDDSRFWQMVSEFMAEVATDLDMDLEVRVDQDSHRFSYLRMAEQVLRREDRPDYLLFICRELVTTQMLTRANDLGVKVFTFNTDVPADTRVAVGLPRETLPNWIGHMAPDNVGAGRTLTALLEQRAERLDLGEPGQPLPMIALSGTLDSSAAKDRNRGLEAAVDDKSSEILQLVYADWSDRLAKEKSLVLLKRYPQVASIWSASDGMAMGAIEAAKMHGKQPGQDVVVGGVDWEPRALDAIRRGELATSLGRHFMGGGLALLLLHDFHHGYDFAKGVSSASLSYQLKPATEDNIHKVERILDPENWRQLDFRRFSRAHSLAEPELSLNADQLMDRFTSVLSEEKGGGQVVSNR
ncbi:ABC transporter substrate-binding protein [Marinobacter metalliresistant]|uniref:ABC transporter substrate-binding protein n=2 Tax=Marinobacter TaxID=2742 RepID=A0ABZ2VY47_9GAMM|nr:sugar ABC transporter substrate-binding protein [Marinobacter sp. Arc7-DN-1]